MALNETSIPCTKETREEIKSLKRGGESYNELLRKMAAQYNPALENDQ
jgi:predicted CopG family antitoxin